MLSNPYAAIVGRQHRAAVDLERDQIANRVGVLGAVQAMNGGRPGIRRGRRRTIERGFERQGRRLVGGLVGPRQANRRHRLLRSLRTTFPDLGMRVRARWRPGSEGKAADLPPVVVAADTVSSEGTGWSWAASERGRVGGGWMGFGAPHRVGERRLPTTTTKRPPTGYTADSAWTCSPAPAPISTACALGSGPLRVI